MLNKIRESIKKLEDEVKDYFARSYGIERKEVVE